jgi:phage baseplate assembly protein V
MSTLREQLAKLVNYIVEPVARRVACMVSRAMLRRIDDTTRLQLAQLELFQGELRDDIERFQEYGFTSVPLAGAEGVAVFVGGNRDHGLIIAVDDRRYRLKSLAPGEVAIYTDEGDSIHLKRDNKMEINTAELTINATTKAEINTPLFKVASSGIIDLDSLIYTNNAVTSVTIGAPQIDLNSS